MRNFFGYFFLILIVISCLSEEGVDLGTPVTFVRYYSGGYGDQGVAFERTADDGFIILGNSFPGKRQKIKLIKTDEQGAPIWQKVYPDFGVFDDYSASGIHILDDGGYIITGTEIKTQKLLLLRVDANGEVVKSVSFGATEFINPADPLGIAITGVSVATNSIGNYVVLGKAVSSEKMVIMEAGKDNLAMSWFFIHPPEAANTPLDPAGGPLKGMFIDESQKVIWSRVSFAKSHVLKSGQGVQLVDYDVILTDPGITENPQSICRYGNGHVIVGNNSDNHIFYRRVKDQGQAGHYEPSVPLAGDATTTGNYVGYVANSISSTQDGGLIILSTASTTVGLEETQDLYLIKYDAADVPQWTSALGSTKFKDTGVSVRQTGSGLQSGGYAVLGTTTQGGLDMIVFIKTNLTGKVE